MPVMSARRAMSAQSRLRLAGILRLVAALAWLTLVLAVFRFPLGRTFGPWAQTAGLSRLFNPAAPGFMLRVSSQPSGGRLWVNGEDLGEVPLMANVRCTEGEAVQLQVTKKGYAPWEREIGCREGRTLTVEARLGR